MLRKFIRLSVLTIVSLGLIGVLSIAGLFLYVAPNLPDIETLKDTQFQVPLRVYSSEEELMAEFGEKRRFPLEYEDVPPLLIKAVLGAEDDRFFEHPGVDYQGILRAVAKLILTGQKVEGGSTITMQVARNFFLSREKTFLRKFSEVLLAFKIEEELSKEDILSLYLNKIYFGNRAYGVGAAAKVYYGKPIRELALAQLAMIAGLPKAPSRYNPIVNPKRALLRRDYVLRRMRELDYIAEDIYQEALLTDSTAKLHSLSIQTEAPYAAEMVRQQMVERYGKAAYTEGFKVYTTISSKLQHSANVALRHALLSYETRHGYRGPEKQIDDVDALDIAEIENHFEGLDNVPMLVKGAVMAIEEDGAYVMLENGNLIDLCWKRIKWAAPYIDGNAIGPAPKSVDDVLHVGDIIRVFKDEGDNWTLGQVPEVEGALVSLRSKDAAIISIVGGYDFYHSKFNRAAQAKRQPGSNLKPFVYSSALEKSYTPATTINDAPVVFDDPGLEDTWRPENYSGRFFGPTRFREALVKSRNLVSIRILRSVGPRYATRYLERFGFDAAQLPNDLSLALGSATITPLEVARGYAVFSNGGYLVEPYLISRIEKEGGELLYEANPVTVCEKCVANADDSIDAYELGELTKELTEEDVEIAGVVDLIQADEMVEDGLLGISWFEDHLELTSLDEEFVVLVEGEKKQTPNPEVPAVVNIAKRTIDERNVYIMTTIMRDIVKRGTGRRALVLKRHDLAGKTGTTNDQRDAWFSGFNADIATTAWVGFDKPHPLGDKESGARAALPMWISFMRDALKDVPEKPLHRPPGLVTVRIDPETGLLAGAGFPNGIFETFRQERAPKQEVETSITKVDAGTTENLTTEEVLELF